MDLLLLFCRSASFVFGAIGRTDGIINVLTVFPMVTHIIHDVIRLTVKRRFHFRIASLYVLT